MSNLHVRNSLKRTQKFKRRLPLGRDLSQTMRTFDCSMTRGRQIVIIKYASLIALLTLGLVVMYFAAYARQSNQEDFVETTDITFHEPFNVPYRQQVLPPEDLMRQDWIEPMKEILRTRHAQDKVVPLVACNNAYYGSLMNWMAGMQQSTNMSVFGVLVLAFDRELHAKLQERNLASVYVEMDSLFRYPDDHPVTNQIQMMRWTTARIVNNFGYDVLLTDIDALFVRDPTPLFNQYATSHIIAQQGKHPKELYLVWNATLCTGMALFRASPITGEIMQYIVMIAKNCVFYNTCIYNYAMRSIIN